MSSRFDLLVDGQPAADVAAALSLLEVEESADQPGKVSLTLPIARTSTGDLDGPSDPRLAPLSNLAVTASAADGQVHCLFDGYVLAQNLHLDKGVTESRIKVWGQDASWLMNTTERAREWVDVTDADVATSIFGEYGFKADVANDEEAPAHSESGHSLMQRATDAQFLQVLARRSGKLFRVFCTDKPGERTASFGAPRLDGDPVATLTLNGAEDANLDSVDFAWDVMRPTAVSAGQALFTTTDAAGSETADSGLAPLDARDLSTFAGQPVTALLTTIVDDTGELSQRARSVLRDAGWFVRCEGEADAGRLGSILRVGSVVMLNAAGSVHSGKYLVWNVRHTITAEAHKMAFTLVRNAVGEAGVAP
jgi:hypothetical protein